MRKFKIVAIGDGAVGKTSLIRRYVDQKWQKDYAPTIGVQFSVKELEIDGDRIDLLLWDLAGQDRFQFVRRSFYSESKGALAVFDLTRKRTYDKIPTWIEDYHKYCPNTPLVLLGNKLDLEDMREINVAEGELLRKQINALAYFETSAATGIEVNSAFEHLARKIKQIIDNTE